MSTPSILIIDDERGIRSLCTDILSRAGYRVQAVDSGEAGLVAMSNQDFDLVFCDINLPGIDGLQVVERCHKEPNPPTLVLITAFPSVQTAVAGMKLGARDYITKPFTPDELRMVAQRAIGEDSLRRENAELRRELGYGKLLGSSAAMSDLRATIAKVARADSIVLLSGESGTGKELVARAIHYEGLRAGRPFIAVNCGALVGTLLESELFGHVRGAFTGADAGKKGLFVAAHKGTIFLDEIGELPLELQPKLLRTLQDGEVKAVGSLQPDKVDTRVIAATNRDLDKQVAEGAFREDLFYRLNVITLRIPPLRERREDIPELSLHFAERAAGRAHRPPIDLHPSTLQWLSEQDWRGNVRELENAIERAVVLATGDALMPEDFEIRRTTVPNEGAVEVGELMSIDELERRHILRVLEACEGQKTKASAILGINRTTLWKKLRQYGVE